MVKLRVHIQYEFDEIPSIEYLAMSEDGNRMDGRTGGQRQTYIPLPSSKCVSSNGGHSGIIFLSLKRT